MTIVAHELKASYAFIERNFFLSRRYWGWELAFLVYSVAGALSISALWLGVASAQAGSTWTEYQGGPGRTGAVADGPAPGYRIAWSMPTPISAVNSEKRRQSS